MFGWAGHDNENGTLGSVEEILDKVRNHMVDEVIEEISFDYENRWVPVSAQLNRVNYPQNCYTVNLTEINKGREVKTLWIGFKAGKTNKVTIHLQGRTLATNRDIYENTFYTKGHEIFVEAGKFRKYAVEISKNVFLNIMEQSWSFCVILLLNHPNPIPSLFNFNKSREGCR